MTKMQIKTSQIAQNWDNGSEVVNILSQIIQPAGRLHLSFAADQVSKIYIRYIEKQNHENIAHGRPEDDDVMERWCWQFWDIVHYTAAQIAHDSPAQDQLAHFVGTLKNMAWNHGVENPWKELSFMRWSSAEMIESDLDSDMTMNLFAFAARLTRDSVSDYLSWATWNFRDVLEIGQYWDEKDLPIDSAAQWIFIAGEKIFQERRKGGHEDSENFWKGKKYEFSPERWQFWKTRFGEISQESGKSDKTRETAKKAFDWMDDIETKEGRS